MSEERQETLECTKCGNTERFAEDLANYVEIWQEDGKREYGEEGDSPEYLGHIWCRECCATVEGKPLVQQGRIGLRLWLRKRAVENAVKQKIVQCSRVFKGVLPKMTLHWQVDEQKAIKRKRGA